MRIRNSKKKFLAALVALACGAGLLVAQNNATFESEGPAGEVTEGSRFEVSFSLKNSVGKRFIAPDFSGFRVSGGPTEMRGAGFINGQSYNHQTWSYELEAGKPGTYTIGPAAVQTSTQTLRTQPLSIRVVPVKPGRANAPPKSDDKLFISGELDRETAWVGQQLHYQIKLYTQVNIVDFDILDLPEFTGFYSQESRRFDTRTQYQNIRGKKYAVRILYELALYPQESGEIVIGSAQVRLGIEQPGSFSSLLGGTPVMLRTQAIKLKVNPLPEPEPADFTGSVGRYNWEISIDKDSISTDDAFTVTANIQGNGDAKRFVDPKFRWPAGLEGFDPKIRNEEAFETGDQFMHRRVLEYVVLPKQPGDYLLEPEMTVFDPDSNAYVTLRAPQPLSVHVVAGANYGKTAAPVDTLAAPAAPESPLAALLQTTLSGASSPLVWGSLLGLLVLIGLIYGIKKYRRRPKPAVRETEKPQPAQASVKEARKRFGEVYRFLQKNDPKLFYHELLKGLQVFLAARLDTPVLELTKELAKAKLQAREVPASTIDNLMRVWQSCELAVFAGRARAEEMAGVWALAQSTVDQL